MVKFFVASLIPLTATAQSLPEPPQIWIDTTLEATPVTGQSIPVPTGGDLQGAIDAASPGDELVLQAGAIFTGNFILRNKSGSGWITIRTSDIAFLPNPGSRIDPSYLPHLARVVTPNANPVFQTEPAAHQYRLIGLEISALPGIQGNYGLIFTGSGTETSIAQLPTDLIVDRSYLHGGILCHCKSGIQLNVVRGSVVDSYFSEFHGIGQDTETILAWDTPGPLKIVDNFLEAGAIGVLFGGVYSYIPGMIPSDIEVRWNTITRPFSWMRSIIPPPKNANVQLSSGGSVPPGKYWYSVVALGQIGFNVSPEQEAFSNLSAETAVTVATGQQTVSLSWSPVAYGGPGDTRTADNYAIMRSAQRPGTPGRTWSYFEIPASGAGAQSASDTGQPFAPWTAWPMPGGTTWEIKNLFECKSCNRVIVDGNSLSNNWMNGQNGTAVLVTPRVVTNNPGDLPTYWAATRNIAFTNNSISNAANAFTIMGYDYYECAREQLCRQTRNILTANNLLTGISGETYCPGCGGDGQGWQIAYGEPGGPTGMFMDHNTLINDGDPMSVDQPVGSMLMNNNIMFANAYGISGTGVNGAALVLAQFFSSAEFASNLYTAPPPGDNPSGNYFPGSFAAVGFNNPNAGDYSLSSGSAYRGLALDGTDPGISLPTLIAAGVVQACTYAVLPKGTLSVAPTGATLVFSVKTAAGCPWLAEAGAPWVQIQSSFAGVGAGSATVSVAPNLSTLTRNGSILLAGRLMHFSQGPGVLTISPTSLPGATVGIAYSQPLSATGGASPYSFTIPPGHLPQGLSLNRSGLVAGIPTQPGSFNLSIGAKNSSQPPITGQATVTLVVAPAPLQIVTTTLSPPVASSQYAQWILSSGGVPPLTFSIQMPPNTTPEELPPGLTLNAGGLISGEATSPGAYAFTVLAADSSHPPQTAQYAYTVTVLPPITFATSSLPAAQLGSAYSQAISVQGGNPPYRFVLTSGSLSSGLTMNSAGVLSGIPTASGNYKFIVKAIDSSHPGAASAKGFSIEVADPGYR